jgi:predicted RND superfamily exporter protein
MQRIAKGILRHKWLVLAAFAVALVVSFLASQYVKINFKLTDYLPDSAESTVGLHLMEDEFASKPANLRVLLEKVTIPEALSYKKKIAAVEGVKDVTWLDDDQDVKQPLSMLDQDSVDDWYKDGNALITAYVDDDLADGALKQVRLIIGENNSMSGDSVQIVETRQRVKEDVAKIMALIVPVIYLILIFTTTSWFEPLLFLIAIGVAIMIGKGTDLMLGEISFITNSCSAVLQLAISMDFAIFLLDAFEHNRQKGMDTMEAMTQAMTKTFVIILSSSFTIICGFAAMLLMKFKIGYDMGIVLAKDIFISLVCVMVMLPALTIVFNPLLEKTHHKPIITQMNRFGKFVSRGAIPIALVVGALVVVPSYLASVNNDFLYGNTEMITNPATKIVQEENRINQLYSKSDQMVLMVKGGDQAREKEMLDEIKKLPAVSSVISYSSKVDATVPVDFVGRSTVDKLVGPNYDRAILTAETDLESDEAFQLVDDARAIAQKYYPGESYLLGGTASIYDIRDTVRKDDLLVDKIALISIGLVLLLDFRALILPFALLATIKSSVYMNLAVPYFTNAQMYYIASLIINAIQLGATVDYAILFTARYLEARKEARARDAVRAAIARATPAILTSASILAVGGLSLGALSSVDIVGQLGVLVGRGAIISTAMVLLMLPALFMLLDPLIRVTTLHAHFYRKGRKNHAKPEKMDGAEPDVEPNADGAAGLGG